MRLAGEPVVLADSGHRMDFARMTRKSREPGFWILLTKIKDLKVGDRRHRRVVRILLQIGWYVCGRFGDRLKIRHRLRTNGNCRKIYDKPCDLRDKRQFRPIGISSKFWQRAKNYTNLSRVSVVSYRRTGDTQYMEVSGAPRHRVLINARDARQGQIERWNIISARREERGGEKEESARVLQRRRWARTVRIKRKLRPVARRWSNGDLSKSRVSRIELIMRAKFTTARKSTRDSIAYYFHPPTVYAHLGARALRAKNAP